MSAYPAGPNVVVNLSVLVITNSLRSSWHNARYARDRKEQSVLNREVFVGQIALP